MMIFIAIGGDGWVVQGLARTYDLVGLDEAPALGRLVAGVDEVFGSIFISAIEVAGPVLLALILTDAAFGVVSRVVPQLNVFAVGFPAKVVVGLLLVTATLPFVAGWIGNELQQDVGTALQAIRVA
jgi:flagellar biosynthetic protein FliR